VHETARNQGGRSVLLPPMSLALDLLSRRRGGTTRLVLALVISRLDYCNSLLAGLPLCTTELLQRVQNAIAQLIFELSPSEHTTPSLLQLHWLPIRWRVQFKLCCLMHAVVTGRCPAYLGSIVQSAKQSRSGLRPSSSDFSVPWTRTKFGERAFYICRPVCVEHNAAPYLRNSRF